MNLRSRLVELINALDELLRNVEMTEEQREKCLRRRALLSAMLDEVLRQKLDKTTGKYKAAVEANQQSGEKSQTRAPQDRRTRGRHPRNHQGRQGHRRRHQTRRVTPSSS